MAWLEQRGNQFHLGIRLGTRKLKRTLQTTDPQEAQDLVARVDRRLKLITQGDLVIPPDADLMTFLLSDGKLEQPAQINAGRPALDSAASPGTRLQADVSRKGTCCEGKLP